MVQINFGNFVKHAGLPKRAYQGHAPFPLQNYYRRTVEYLCMIPFSMVKNNFGNFVKHAGLPKRP